MYALNLLNVFYSNIYHIILFYNTYYDQIIYNTIIEIINSLPCFRIARRGSTRALYHPRTLVVTVKTITFVSKRYEIKQYLIAMNVPYTGK